MKKHEDTIGGGCSLTLSPSEYSAINILHQFLDQFYKTTTNLCTTKLRTVGLVLFFIDHIAELITSCRNESCQGWLKTLADDMCNRVHGFTGQVYNGFTFMCAILDPRIKRELVPDVLNTDKNLEEARGYFVREYVKNNHFIVIPSNGFGGAHESAFSSGIENTDAVSFAGEFNFLCFLSFFRAHLSQSLSWCKQFRLYVLVFANKMVLRLLNEGLIKYIVPAFVLTFTIFYRS
jgi:Domain of unknown function (DUF4413)